MKRTTKSQITKLSLSLRITELEKDNEVLSSAIIKLEGDFEELKKLIQESYNPYSSILKTHLRKNHPFDELNQVLSEPYKLNKPNKHASSGFIDNSVHIKITRK